jgi:hypothetical protein
MIHPEANSLPATWETKQVLSHNGGTGIGQASPFPKEEKKRRKE